MNNSNINTLMVFLVFIVIVWFLVGKLDNDNINNINNKEGIAENEGFYMFEPLVSYVAKNPEFKTSNHDNIIVYDNLEEAINSWQNIFRQNQHATNPDLPPFSGGLAGYFSYDLSKQLNKDNKP